MYPPVSNGNKRFVHSRTTITKYLTLFWFIMFVNDEYKRKFQSRMRKNSERKGNLGKTYNKDKV